jgi:heterotetrameric sarcosine oxidase gamma subunit
VADTVAGTVPVARSPIEPAAPAVITGGWAVSGRRSTAGLTITDCTPVAKVAVRARWDGAMAAALGVPLGRAARAGAVLTAAAGPGEWLALAPVGTAAGVGAELGERAARSAPGELVSVVDLTHGRALMRITGAAAVEVLAGECPVDLADDMVPDGTALRAPVAELAVDIIRDDRSGMPSYLLHCERSSGQYLFGTLLSAGRELGLDVDGFRGPGA